MANEKKMCDATVQHSLGQLDADGRPTPSELEARKGCRYPNADGSCPGHPCTKEGHEGDHDFADANLPPK